MSSAARIAVINAVRSQFAEVFEKKVKEMIATYPFQRGKSVVLWLFLAQHICPSERGTLQSSLSLFSQKLLQEIAKAVAIDFGVGEDSVEMVELHNHWKSAEFLHQISTPMPPPPKKGMKKEPPVITSTRFKVVAQSAIIRAGYIQVNEDMQVMGNDVWMVLMQRPNVIDPNNHPK